MKLTGVFSRLGSRKVLVIGDLLFDSYTIGKARRISPEAPVAIIQVVKEEYRAGGAGNAVLNLVSLGMQVSIIGRIGADHSGELLKQSLKNEGVDISGIFVQSNYFTPIKNRIIADNQQIVRVDHEQISPISEELEKKVIAALPTILDGLEMIAISDYGKGFLSSSLLSTLIELAQTKNIPVITDPKGIDFKKYNGSTIIKPNFSEAVAASGLPAETPIHLIAAKILHQVNAKFLMITRSEAGISIFDRVGNEKTFPPIQIREVKDVTGAGDTVLAMLTCALANQLELDEAISLCNVAAGIAIEHFGCARITLPELAQRLLELNASNKIFDGEHLFALQKALYGKKSVLLSIDSAQGMSSSIFSAIRKLAQSGALIIYLRDPTPSDTFIDLLSSLREVHFIVLANANMHELNQTIAPERCYALNEDQLIPSNFA